MDINKLYLAIGALTAFYFLLKRLSGNDILKSMGVAHEKPLPIVGNFLPVLLKKKSFIDLIFDLYDKFSSEKVFGFYNLFGNPVIIIADPDLIKQVAVKDFEYFVNRHPAGVGKFDDISGRSLLLAQNQHWKDTRNMLNPMYTSAKLKQVYHELRDCIFDFVKFYKERAQASNGKVNLKVHEAMARATADGIARTAFGFQADSTRDESCEVFEIANDIETQFASQSRGIILQVLPRLANLLGFQIFSTKVQKWFHQNVLHEMKRRQQLNIQKPDLVHQFLLAQKDSPKWVDNDFVAQGVTMFLGGFSTTTVLMEALFYEIADHPEIQQTLIAEVDEMLATLNGEKISYEKLNQMKYLEMVINEGLRKWDPVPAATRIVGKDYDLKTDAKTYHLKKGTSVFLAYGSILNDSKYFKNPEKFDPERFSDENKGNIHPGTLLSFGLGPRICIGSRYALMDIKLILFGVLANFTIEKSAKTQAKLERNQAGNGFTGGVEVELKLRK